MWWSQVPDKRCHFTTPHLQNQRYRKSTLVAALLRCRSFACRSTARKQDQFLLRDAKLRRAAFQTDQKLRENPDAGFVQILEAAKMDDHFGCKFRFMTRGA